eukprot:7158236-Karenia_brevis.AAC.1
MNLCIMITSLIRICIPRPPTHQEPTYDDQHPYISPCLRCFENPLAHRRPSCATYAVTYVDLT